MIPSDKPYKEARIGLRGGEMDGGRRLAKLCLQPYVVITSTTEMVRV